MLEVILISTSWEVDSKRGLTQIGCLRINLLTSYILQIIKRTCCFWKIRAFETYSHLLLMSKYEFYYGHWFIQSVYKLYLHLRRIPSFRKTYIKSNLLTHSYKSVSDTFQWEFRKWPAMSNEYEKYKFSYFTWFFETSVLRKFCSNLDLTICTFFLVLMGNLILFLSPLVPQGSILELCWYTYEIL